MNIEELAFKDRTQLANLNELDLLNIIEILQKDRKEWINHFTQTHNESVDIQKEIQELKKQLENYKKLRFKHLVDKNNNLENQQKEFIKYLEDEIKLYKNDIQNFSKDYNVYFSLINDLRVSKAKIEEILQKYKSIIGVLDENNIK